VLEVLADDPQRAVALLKTRARAVACLALRRSVPRHRRRRRAERPRATIHRGPGWRVEGIRVREAREEDYSLEDVFLVIAEKGVVAA